MRDNSKGYVGVAKGVSASDVYVWGACYYDYDDERTYCSSTAIAAGLDEAVEWGVDVVNMSLSGSMSDNDVAQAVATAYANDILLVAAAGNNLYGQNRYPAAYSQVIGVSGVSEDSTFSGPSGTQPCGGGFSNWGSHVEMSAPFYAYSTIGVDSYDEYCGTSMATPFVTGAIALMRAHEPGLNRDTIRSRMHAAAMDRGSSGWDSYFGYGTLDAEAALWLPRVDSMAGPTWITQSGNYQWEAFASRGGGAYTYDWKYRVYHQTPTCNYTTGWMSVGDDDETYNRFVRLPGYDFQIWVEVEDTLGDSASKIISVGVSDEAECPW